MWNNVEPSFKTSWMTEYLIRFSDLNWIHTAARLAGWLAVCVILWTMMHFFIIIAICPIMEIKWWAMSLCPLQHRAANPRCRPALAYAVCLKWEKDYKRRQNSKVKGERVEVHESGWDEGGSVEKMLVYIVAIRVVEFLSRGYKIRNFFAEESTYTKEISKFSVLD